MSFLTLPVPITGAWGSSGQTIMNMVGVFAGAAITNVLGKWSDNGDLGLGFAVLAAVVAVALAVQLFALRPKTDNME
jgi:hypothetical protein